MIDYLIMLLSTDWFLPYWSEIGVSVSDAERSNLQEGCRVIVGEFMHDDGDYYQIDFSEQRRQETHTRFLNLVGRLGADVSPAVKELGEAASPLDDLSTGIMMKALIQDLSLTNERSEIPHLDDAIRMRVIEARARFDADPNEFSTISIESHSAWDRYVEGIFTETPGALVNTATFAVQRLRLKDLWNRISEGLSETQRENLISWCRAVSKAGGIPIDPIPSYILDSAGASGLRSHN